MLPLLRFTSDKKNHSSLEAVEKMSEVFRLSEEQKTRGYPSGKSVPIFYDRVNGARADLVIARMPWLDRLPFMKGFVSSK